MYSQVPLSLHQAELMLVAAIIMLMLVLVYVYFVFMHFVWGTADRRPKLSLLDDINDEGRCRAYGPTVGIAADQKASTKAGR